MDDALSLSVPDTTSGWAWAKTEDGPDPAGAGWVGEVALAIRSVGGRLGVLPSGMTVRLGAKS